MISETTILLKTSAPPNTAAQQIYLSPDGHIILSDDAIFDTEHWAGVPVQDIFPVLESCYPLFFQPDNVAFSEFKLPAVNLTNDRENAYFDFYFLKIYFDAREAIFWWMEERTQFYQQKQEAQQLAYQEIVLG